MKLFANELEANQQVQTTFLVLNKDVRQKKTGEPYLSLILGDKTGDIDAKMWDGVADIVDTFERNDYVKIRGQATVYQNKLQLRVDRMMRADERDIEPSDYFPASKRDRDEMYAELMGYIDTMRNPHLKALLEAFFADNEIARRYKTAPAAKSIHHAWIGGLIEHVLSLMTLARFTARHYPEVDEDLLLTGVVLHDIGKIHELTYDRGFGYSDEGQLIGHILIALRMLDEKVRQVPDFPPKLRMLVEHLIASHHGEMEFGSPKVPCFLEAMLLHHLDNLDSKMETVRTIVQRDSLLDGNFTGYAPMLERSLLKKERFLAEEQLTPPAPRPIAPPAPPAKQAKSVPTTGSLFGDKLSSALDDRK
jgi:3'-5' exoribonuclease